MRLPDTAAAVLRMARSVRPDGNAAVACPIEFRWLPAGFTLTSITVRGGTPVDWSCDIQTSEAARQPYPPEVVITTAPIQPGPGDTAVSVRGGTGYVHADGMVKVVPVTMVELDRYGVLVRSSEPEPVVVRVLDGLQDTPVDLRWLGRR